MKQVLGISAYYHDSAATLVVDGRIVAAAQEERFSRIKHDPAFPTQAIKYCLEQSNCKLEDIDAVIFYDKPMLKFERLLETYLANAPRGFLSFLRAMPIWLKEKLYLKSVLRQELRSLIHSSRALAENTSVEIQKKKQKRPVLPTLLFSEHHHSHAASAFYPSPFEEAVVLCLDGVGEWATSSAWLGKNNSLTPLWEIQFPHSLGLLYSAFTYYCGFRVNSGEYKLMGLAPYGEPKYVDTILNNLIDLREDGSFALNMAYFDYPTGDRMVNQAFEALFEGPAKLPDEAISQKEMDLARSIQVVTEEVVLKIARHAFAETGCDNLCLAGGVALNCVANGRILREGPFKQIWIQPAAGDAGGALGCALIAWHEYFEQPRIFKRSPNQDTHESHQSDKDNQDTHNAARIRWTNADSMQGAYLGPQYSDEQIEQHLLENGIPYTKLAVDELFSQVAKIIVDGNVVGWFQGRMEFGPRALGNRSIIGDPRNSAMQTQMNVKIKQRESFRPFAPAVLAEHVSEYFEMDVASPYMLLVADVQSHLRTKIDENVQCFGIEKLKQQRSSLPAVTHVDYSARVQTVHKQTNPEFHQLINAFYALTGVPVLINTSFNVRGEPPVCSPADAVRCFLATEMDYLVMGSYLVDKKKQDPKHIEQAKQVTFEKD